MGSYSDFLKQPKSRNILHNGNFNVWQRGGSFPAASGYTADRWGYGDNGAVICSVTRDTNVPTGNSNYSYKVTATTRQASFTGLEYVHFVHSVEGFVFQAIANQTVTMSFWVKATVPGIYSCWFRDSLTAYSLIKEYTINQSNTWEFKYVTFYWDTSVGTYVYTTSAGANVGFIQACGPTYATSTIGSWVSGNYLASTNQVNGMASSGSQFRVSQVQLELGAVPTTFDFLSYDDILDLCYRYYQVITYSHLSGVNLTTGNCIFYGGSTFVNKRAIPASLGITTPRIWSVQNGWRAATAIVNTWKDSHRILFYFRDTAVANYVAGQSLLISCDCAISADI